MKQRNVGQHRADNALVARYVVGNFRSALIERFGTQHGNHAFVRPHSSVGRDLAQVSGFWFSGSEIHTPFPGFQLWGFEMRGSG